MAWDKGRGLQHTRVLAHARYLFYLSGSWGSTLIPALHLSSLSQPQSRLLAMSYLQSVLTT